MCDARVMLQELCKDEEILRVQVLLPKVQVLQGILLDREERQGTAMQRQGLHIVLIDKLSEVL